MAYLAGLVDGEDLDAEQLADTGRDTYGRGLSLLGHDEGVPQPFFGGLGHPSQQLAVGGVDVQAGRAGDAFRLGEQPHAVAGGHDPVLIPSRHTGDRTGSDVELGDDRPVIRARLAPPLARVFRDRWRRAGAIGPHRPVGDVVHQSVADQDVVDQLVPAAVAAAEPLVRRNTEREVPQPLAVALVGAGEPPGFPALSRVGPAAAGWWPRPACR